MNRELESLITQFITLPMVLKIFKRDRGTFSDWKMRNVYWDKLDAAMGSAQEDLNEVKRSMYAKHHIRVLPLKPQGEIYPYQWKTPNEEGFVKFSSDELRDLTRNAMRYYLQNTPPRPPGAEDRSWY